MPDIRVTAQYIEVLASVSSDLRVTAQYVEYLRAYNEGFITSVLSVTDTIVGVTVRNRSLTQGLYFSTDIIAAGVPQSRSVTNSLTDDRLEYNPETGEYTLVHNGLYDAVERQLIGIRIQTDDFNVIDVIDYVFLKLSGTSETVTSDFTSLDHDVVVAFGLESTLNVSHAVTYELGRGISDTLDIGQAIVALKISNKSIVSSLAVSDTVDYTLNENNRIVLCTYTPFVGASSDSNAPAPPSTLSPTIIPLDQITLTCSAASTSITLRNPELGDKDIAQFQRVNRETRGGTLVVFSDPIWPRTQKLILEFTGLTEAKGQEFLTFLNLSLGQYVELTDWESTTWGGILTSPQSPIIRDGDCKVTATVEFEGGKLSLPTIIDTLIVADTIAATTIDTLWSDGTGGAKLLLQSGQFTSTVRQSQSVSGIDTNPNAIGWDGTDTPWVGVTAKKLYLQSGQFSSTLNTSLYVGAFEGNVAGIAWDGTDTPWCGSSSNKMFLQSGQFNSTVKDSISIAAIDTHITGMSWDGTNYPWSGNTADKLYLQSGPFTSTLVDSQYIGGVSSVITDITWNGLNTPWIDVTNKKLYMQQGQFTSTLLDSHALGGSTLPTGICPTNFHNNL